MKLFKQEHNGWSLKVLKVNVELTTPHSSKACPYNLKSIVVRDGEVVNSEASQFLLGYQPALKLNTMLELKKIFFYSEFFSSQKCVILKTCKITDRQTASKSPASNRIR